MRHTSQSKISNLDSLHSQLTLNQFKLMSHKCVPRILTYLHHTTQTGCHIRLIEVKRQ